VQLLAFQDLAQLDSSQRGFGCWSYFVLRDGQSVAERVRDFEEKQAAGRYRMAGRTFDSEHEIRWAYAALYLMAQRLATQVQHTTDRGTRRRAERNNQVAPPVIRVITLRRLEAARQRQPNPEAIDWRWQWEVRGHWRDQWYPSEGVHKPKFIEAYIKGPPDKPLKPGALKLFTAVR
jgi:hypothetical protein